MIPSAIPNFLVGAQVSLGSVFLGFDCLRNDGREIRAWLYYRGCKKLFQNFQYVCCHYFNWLSIQLVFLGLVKLLERRVLAWRKGGMRDAVEKVRRNDDDPKKEKKSGGKHDEKQKDMGSIFLGIRNGSYGCDSMWFARPTTTIQRPQQQQQL